MHSSFDRRTASGIEIAENISHTPILETISMAELSEY